MDRVYEEKNMCCGCSACVNICPKGAISMEEDEEGFLYPVIDEEICIDCGLCQKVCDFKNGRLEKSELENKAYAARHKDEEVLLKSSSGGMFTAISDLCLENGGVVYGAAFDEDFNVYHKRTTTKEERNTLRGSKYVQSDIGDIFAQVKKDCENGENILFTGTPCQCAGLRSYLENSKCDTSKLILCDLVCHGVPSPMLWREHIKRLEKKGKIRAYNFRSKVYGWSKNTEKVTYENGKEDYKSALSQEHKMLFYSHNALRPSCHECPYTNVSRLTDVTIADYRGIEKNMPDFIDERGVSLILLHTEKGYAVFDAIKDSLIARECPIEKCLQPQLMYPSWVSENRDAFWQEYREKGYDFVAKKYCGVGFLAGAKKFLKNIMRKANLYDIAKKILKKG